MFHTEDMAKAETHFHERARVASPDDSAISSTWPPALESLDVCPNCVVAYASNAAQVFLMRGFAGKDENVAIDPEPLLVSAWISGFTIGYTLSQKWDELPEIN